MLVAEANQWPTDVRPFGDGAEFHMAYQVPLMPRIYMALRQEDRLPITEIIAQTPGIGCALILAFVGAWRHWSLTTAGAIKLLNSLLLFSRHADALLRG